MLYIFWCSFEHFILSFVNTLQIRHCILSSVVPDFVCVLTKHHVVHIFSIVCEGLHVTFSFLLLHDVCMYHQKSWVDLSITPLWSVHRLLVPGCSIYLWEPTSVSDHSGHQPVWNKKICATFVYIVTTLCCKHKGANYFIMYFLYDWSKFLNKACKCVQ